VPLERALLRVGEYLVGVACRRLPPEIQDERYREWAAELPAIVHDREIRPAPYRAVRMLSYAADTLRGTALMPDRARRRLAAATSALVPGLLLALLLAWCWSGDGPAQGRHKRARRGLTALRYPRERGPGTNRTHKK